MAHPPEYLAFLRAWLAFAEDPYNNPHKLSTRYGLCFNSVLYDRSTKGDDTLVEYPQYLSDHLDAVCGDNNTPFNTEHPGSYEGERDKTKNHQRLTFVRKELGL